MFDRSNSIIKLYENGEREEMMLKVQDAGKEETKD